MVERVSTQAGRAARVTGLAPGQRGLNIGCGRNLRARPWVNTDVGAPDGGAPGSSFVRFDAGFAPWPLAAATFDVVFAGCVLPHLPAPSGRDPDPLVVFFEQAHRVLAPGGRFVVTAPHPARGLAGLSAPHHHRVITWHTFKQYFADHRARGFDGSRPATFELESVELGILDGARDESGRPLGHSRWAPEFWPIGRSRLGLWTHVFRRLRLGFLMRGQNHRITLRRPVETAAAAP